MDASANTNITVEHDITGVILVGGKSLRMGRDKAFLEIAGKPLFERVLKLFKETFAQVSLVGDREERFAGYSLTVLRDIYPGSVIGGLYTGLYHATTKFIFASSCDLPFPNGEVLRYLCSFGNGFDVVVPKTTHGYEPLFALYSKNCLKPMKFLIESGNFRVYDLYPQVRAREVSCEELKHLDRDGKSFVNINTPEEYEEIMKEILS